MQSEIDTGFTVSFTALLKRYGIVQSTLSHRIKQLKLKTRRRGRNVYLSLNQLAQLDALHRFLQEHPRNTIREFLSLSGGSSTRIEATAADNSLSNYYQNNDSSHQQQVSSQPELIDEYRRMMNEQRHIINDQLRLLDKQKLEIEELKAHLGEMQQQVDHAEREKLMLRHKIGRYRNEADMHRDICCAWQNFWKSTFPYPVAPTQIHGAAEVLKVEPPSIWVKTRLPWIASEPNSVSESDFVMAANSLNSRLPQFVD